MEAPASRIVLRCEPRLNQKFSEQGSTPPKLSLSGLVPGILTNRLGLRTHTPRTEEMCFAHRFSLCPLAALIPYDTNYSNDADDDKHPLVIRHRSTPSSILAP